MNRPILAATILAGIAGAAFGGIQLTRADYLAGQNAMERGDVARALDEFRRAAEAGDPRAQFRLGQAYERGENVLQDYVIAHMWYNLGAAKGHDQATAARDALAARMTAEQLANAQQLARQRLAMADDAGVARRTETGAVGWARPQQQQQRQEQQAQAAAVADREITKEDVAQVQRRLNALGYQAGPVDGVMGRRTRTALKAWQADIGMDPTGEVTPRVVARIETARTVPDTLETRVAPKPEPTRQAEMSQRELVRAIQRELDQAGYDPGPVDGVMGSRTREAIRAYQRAHAMPVTGEASPQLLAALGVPGRATARAEPAARPAVRETTGESVAETELRDTGRLTSYVQSIQQELAEHGYFGGPTSGGVTPRLRDAIREYQADAGLAVTGRVTEDLLDHLRYARPEVYKQEAARRR